MSEGEIEGGFVESVIYTRPEDTYKVGATGAFLTVPNTITINSGTTDPGSDLVMTEVEATVADPIMFFFIYIHLSY